MMNERERERKHKMYTTIKKLEILGFMKIKTGSDNVNWTFSES